MYMYIYEIQKSIGRAEDVLLQEFVFLVFSRKGYLFNAFGKSIKHFTCVFIFIAWHYFWMFDKVSVCCVSLAWCNVNSSFFVTLYPLISCSQNLAVTLLLNTQMKKVNSIYYVTATQLCLHWWGILPLVCLNRKENL